MVYMDSNEKDLQKEFKRIFSIYLNKFHFQSFHKNSLIFLFLDIFGLILLGIIIYPQNYELTLFCFLQGTFCLLGYYYLQEVTKKDCSSRNQSKNDPQSPDSSSHLMYSQVLSITFWVFCIGFLVIKLFSLSHLPSNFNLDSEEWVLFWYAILVSISEELFFRGFLISIFLNLRSKRVQIDLSLKPKPQTNLYNMKFGELMYVIIIQSIIWTLLHVNYYGDLSVLLPIFVSGILFGLLFVFKKDIRIPIALHMFGNLIANLEMFF